MKVLTGMALSLFSLTSLADCVPVADWSGQLIAPKASERDTLGGTQIKIENAPAQYRSLIGQVLILRLNKNLPTYDVTIGPRTKAMTQKDGIILADGVDGLKNVSALESLAHSRPNDIVRVEIRDPQVNSQTITTQEDVRLIDGTHRCLVKFVSVDNDSASVQFYDKESKQFSNHTEDIQLNYLRHLPQDDFERLNITGIETTPPNSEGWDVYGTFENDRFVAHALEAYGLYKVSDRSINEIRANQYWSRVSKTDVAQRWLNGSSANVTKETDFLVVHAFGSYNKHGMTLGKYRGHASIGFAKIEEHPITGEDVFSVVYKQLYGHSGAGVFPATQHSSAYNGNLYRGRSFMRPTTDVLYPINSDLKEEIENHFDEVIAGYRVGYGAGWARITSLTSCVRDTANELLLLLNRDSKLPRDDIRSLIKRRLGRARPVSENQRHPELVPEDIDSKVSTLVEVRRNLTISVPRNFQDAMLAAFLSHRESPVIVLSSVQAGHLKPDATGHAPDSIRSYFGTILNYLKQAVFK